MKFSSIFKCSSLNIHHGNFSNFPSHSFSSHKISDCSSVLVKLRKVVLYSVAPTASESMMRLILCHKQPHKHSRHVKQKPKQTQSHHWRHAFDSCELLWTIILKYFWWMAFNYNISDILQFMSSQFAASPASGVEEDGLQQRKCNWWLQVQQGYRCSFAIWPPGGDIRVQRRKRYACKCRIKVIYVGIYNLNKHYLIQSH